MKSIEIIILHDVPPSEYHTAAHPAVLLLSLQDLGRGYYLGSHDAIRECPQYLTVYYRLLFGLQVDATGPSRPCLRYQGQVLRGLIPT